MHRYQKFAFILLGILLIVSFGMLFYSSFANPSIMEIWQNITGGLIMSIGTTFAIPNLIQRAKTTLQSGTNSQVISDDARQMLVDEIGTFMGQDAALLLVRRIEKRLSQ